MYGEDKLSDMNCLPLSSSQMNIWNLEMAHPGLPMNNICTALKIEGNLNLEYLQTCMELAFRAFPSLRTRITVRDGKPGQYITEELPGRTALFDFTETDEEGLTTWFHSVAREHFMLEDHFLCEMLLFKTSESSGGILTRVHHIIADAWSHALVTNHIIHNYFRLLSGLKPDHEAVPFYEEHIINEQNYLQSRAFEKDKRYWKEALKNISPGLAKEYQCALVSPVGYRKSYRLSNRLNRLIGSFCEKEKVSPFAVFYMGLAIYLRRMKGQERFCIGVPTINRLNYREKQAGGMFVNTLPFVNELDISMSWNQFNEKLQSDWFSLLCHQRIPFEYIKKLAQEGGHEGNEPLFHIVLSYQNGKMDHLRGARVFLEGRWLYSGYQSEALCIHLSSRDGENQFTVDYDYLTQIFSEQEIEKLHETLSRILKEALREPDKPISCLSLLGEETEERVIFDFNQTDTWYEREKCIAQKLDEMMQLYPDRAAVIFEGKRISYKELGRQAGIISERIREITGDEQGTVALLMERSDRLFAALTGIIFSGNSWLFIDTELPSMRKEELLADSHALFVITDDSQALDGEDARKEILWGQDTAVHVLEFTALISGKDSPVSTDPIVLSQPDDLAYLVYTSGSTGLPKAVEVEQHSVVNLAAAMQPLYPKGAVLSICNVGFDAFLLESVSALLNGKTIVMASGQEMNHPRKIGRLILNYDAGFMALTPSRLSAYMAEEEFRKALSHLETIICGGESFPLQLYRTLSGLTSAVVYNQYGPSEATVAVSHAAVNGRESVNIGAPLQNCRIYILDEYMNPLPPGSAGEIYIGGECLARGYHSREELTKESFLADPFIKGARIYRTGDYGKWSEDGRIFYLGRKDDQVKLLGHRIELSEIESVLMLHPGVRTAAVTVSEGMLTAYFAGDEELTEEALLTYAANYLPRYLIPAAAVRVEKLPLTTNGKVDFRLLEKPVIANEQVHPADEVEEVLLDIWKRVLKREELGVQSDYFRSGGDSLNAVLMLLEVEKEFSRSISVTELYGCSTLRRLGNLIRGKAVESGNRKAGIKKAQEQAFYPLTPSQESFYVLQQLDETKISYNMPMAFRLGTWLDFPRLEQAFRKMAEQDPVLRTVFMIESGQVTARVLPQSDFRMEWMEAAGFEEAMHHFVRPFDLEKGPLFRAAMVKLPENEPGLLLDMHHIISDGISMQILLHRLDLYYRGGEVKVPELTYADYAWWVKENSGQGRDSGRKFWMEQMRNSLPEKTLPLDRPRPPVFDGKGAEHCFVLPEALSGSIKEFCEEHEVTPFILLLSVYGLLVSRYSGSEKVVAGTPVSGRHEQNMEEMTGVFVHTLPVFIHADPELTFETYLHNVRHTVSGMLDHQEISLEELTGLSGAERSRDRNTLFDILFTMTPLQKEDVTIGGADLIYMPYDTHAVKMDLNLEVTYMKGGYRFRFEYAKSLFDEVTIAFYGRCCVQGLKEVLKHPEKRLGVIEMLDAADRIRLLEQPKRIRTPYDAAPVDCLLDETAAANPDRIAVQWGDGQFDTFGTLKEKSDLLATVLENKGITAGDKVAFLTKRTGLMPVLMFGILKAGAAYVPVDPAFPKERIRYMLEQAGVRMAVYGQEELVLDGMPCEALVWDEEELLRLKGDSVFHRKHQSSDAANVIFTSGTTGKPKGVVMLHRALSNLSAHLEPLLGTWDEKILCASNCVFDVFTTETILALGKGYPVSIADEEEMLLPWKMAERIRRDRVTILQLTPSRLQMCLGDESFCASLSGIHRIILLGEPWGMELKRRLKDLTDARIFNIYGPTETSVHNCQGDITDEDSIHIGKPIGNCRYYLLDEKGKPLPPTAVGEIYIAGECLSAGYIGQPELTEEVFVPDCYSKEEKMYRTGDLGRLRADGNWQCLGRVDTQLKLNGHRIEPLEIAEVMQQSGLVKEAAVVPVLRDGIPEYLRGAAVAAPGYQEGALREFLLERLPDYMIPSEILTFTEMPRTASGKTDLKKLALPDIKSAAEAGEREMSEIAALWREVLGKNPDPEVSFFEQGGTSLMAILILNRYHQKQYDFSINDFYHYPTLDAQEKLLSGKKRDGEQKTAQEQTVTPEIPRKSAGVDECICSLGAILLTGASGYLGSYILKKLLEYGGEKVYCLVRGNGERLKEVLDTYFDSGFYEKYAGRIEIATGDITKEGFGLPQDIYDKMVQEVTRVFHCAADVRHYAPPEELNRTNIEGTAEVLHFVKKAGAAMMHMSTVSVAGNRLLEEPGRTYTFHEEDLDAGQNWQDNPYVKSKLLAEKLVDDAVKEGAHARIFRIGRLAANSYNGKFQKNPQSNAYYRLIKGILELGMMPEALYHQPIELTPVNQAAEAVVRLSGSTGGTYHIYCPYETEIGPLAKACAPIERVSADDFEHMLEKRMTESDSPYIQALAQVWYEGKTDGSMVQLRQDKTLKKLAELDFWWQKPDIDKQKMCFLQEESEGKV